ncbi:MAG: OsmC family protein [Alphaproteobacteria bacterium]|nr:OsmC family protein [Alphaproteobacteria bacterium]MCY4498895.1 OsmC family protein [Rhodospirillaceae bacterium]
MQFRMKQVFDSSREKLREKPSRGLMSATVESRQVDGFESHVSIRDFTIVADEPRNFGGGDKGPKPSEILLAALAACQEVTYRLYADAMEIPLRSVSVTVTGEADLRGFVDVDGIRAGLQRVTGTVTLDTPAGPEDIWRLRARVDAHCPVLDSLQTPIEVSLDLEVTNSERQAAE